MVAGGMGRPRGQRVAGVAGVAPPRAEGRGVAPPRAEGRGVAPRGPNPRNPGGRGGACNNFKKFWCRVREILESNFESIRDFSRPQ